jgi:hypothetical protein
MTKHLKAALAATALLATGVVVASHQAAALNRKHRIEEFSRDLADQLARQDDALNGPTGEAALSSEGNGTGLDDGWSVRNFYLRLQATIGFSIPEIANLTIVPSVELVFHRVAS